MKKTNSLRLIAITQILFLVLPFFMSPAKAQSITDVSLDNWSGMSDPLSSTLTDSIPGMTQQALGEVLKSFGLGEEPFREAGEFMNAWPNKKQAPEVQLLFSPTSPEIGDKITATALPKYFKTPKESLYFNWYLKHAKCEESKKGDNDYEESCNLDKDNDVDINDWKIEAMRIIASNKFRTERADYTTTQNTDDDEDGFGPMDDFIQNGVSSDNCDDAKDDPTSACTRAPFGSSNAKEPSDGFRCYVNDYQEGVTYEIVEGSTLSDGRPYYRFSKRGDSYCGGTGGSCEVNISCGGDSGSYNFVNPGIPPSGEPSNPGMPGRYEEEDGFVWKSVSEGDGSLVIIIPKSYSCDSCTVCVGSEECNTCSGVLDGGETSINQNSICTHAFPQLDDFTIGDNQFTGEEEEFWRTNPNDSDTAGDGIGDEAAVAGVGRDKLEWTYNSGDQVGVVVEGESMNQTKYDDASYMIMYALPKNNFNTGEDDCEITDKGSYTKEINGRSVEIESAEFDINDCIKENLIDPLEGGQPENIQVDLTASPENPVNDSSSEGNRNGDRVSVQAMVSNASNNNTQNMYYRWTIEGNEEFTLDEGWEDITDAVSVGMTEGLNKDSISFNLNLTEGSAAYANVFGGNTQGFIRVRSEAEENFDSGVTRHGTGEVVIKAVTGQNNQIEIARAREVGGKLVFDDSLEARLCRTSDLSLNTSNCQVSSGEIVAARITNGSLRNFSWTLNGEPIECTSDMSDSCYDSSQGNIVFFPIIGSSGERYVLDVRANDLDPSGNSENLGVKTEITQSFNVVEPALKLVPAGGINEDCSSQGAGFEAKELGVYVNVQDDTDNVASCSTKVFEGSPGQINVEALFSPSWIANYASDMVWTVNGEVQETTGNTLSYDTTNIPTGSTVSVSVSGKYAQDIESKQALINHWNVSQLNMKESNLNDSIKIKITEPDPGAQTTLKKSTNIMASLITNLPSQMVFMLRIVLTIVTIIFISGTVFSLGGKRV